MVTVGTVASVLSKRANSGDNTRYWGILCAGVDVETSVCDYLRPVLGDTEGWVEGLPSDVKRKARLVKVKSVLKAVLRLEEVNTAWGCDNANALRSQLQVCLSEDAMAEIDRACSKPGKDDKEARIRSLQADIERLEADKERLTADRERLEDYLAQARAALMHTATVALSCKRRVAPLREAALAGVPVHTATGIAREQ